MEPGSWITTINVRSFERKKLVKISKDVNVNADDWNANKSFFDAKSGSFWALASNAEGQEITLLVQIYPNGEVTKYPWPCYRKNIIHRRNHNLRSKYQSDCAPLFKFKSAKKDRRK
jgi:hypothetical protein